MLLLLRNIEQANAATVLPSLLHHMCVKALNGLTFFHNLIHTERIVEFKNSCQHGTNCLWYSYIFTIIYLKTNMYNSSSHCEQSIDSLTYFSNLACHCPPIGLIGSICLLGKGPD